MLFATCRKTEYIGRYETKYNFDESKFFSGTEGSDATTKKLVSFFKNKQMTNPNYLPNLVQKHGYPVWNKTINNYAQHITSRNTTEEIQDSVIHLPLVQTGIESVSSFIEAVINDSISVELYEAKKHKLLPHGTINSTSLTAEKYINHFFMLENNVFNNQFFRITDTSLFKSLLPSNSGSNVKLKFINVSADSTSGTALNSFGIDGCFYYKSAFTTTTINSQGVAVVVGHSSKFKICVESMLSLYNALGGDILGTIASLDLGNDLGGGGGNSNTSGGSSTGGATSGTSNGGDNNVSITDLENGYVDATDLLTLLNQVVSL